MAEGTDNKSSPSADKGGKRSFAAPTGTRDLYPLELARRRWIEDKWRKTAVRHGFEEIDGPTFEHTELYTAKSGDGIVGEIFSTFSGKDPQAVQQMGQRLAAGELGAIAPYALRPEFTPTLARMYAAKAKQFPQPCKWFWQQNCFRGERPQRGRLREFMQWNCDIIGGNYTESSTDRILLDFRYDREVLETCIGLLESVQLRPEHVRIHVSDRKLISLILRNCGVRDTMMDQAFLLLDRRAKLPADKFNQSAFAVGLEVDKFDALAVKISDINRITNLEQRFLALRGLELGGAPANEDLTRLRAFVDMCWSQDHIGDWLAMDFSIVRGLAYYTGMVFEVIVDGERAVAGGGRYDNLIETFGGPPTPAVGFGMGDVVLSLVLQDKGLMPSDKQIAADLGLRPDVFVISNGQPESDALVGTYLADLRRKGMHARRSYKTTKNVGKLLQDAAACNARYAVIIESATDVTLKDMDANTQDKGPAAELLPRITPPPR